MKKIRVLQFTIAQSKGGRTQYILNNWKYIDKRVFQFDFVTFSKTLDFEEELIEQGCKVFHLSCYYKDDPTSFIRELDEVFSYGYDVIHIHTSYWEDDVVERRAKANGIRKIIIHSHSTGISKALSKTEVERKTKHHFIMRELVDFELATDYCACSREAAEWVFGKRVPEEKIRILNNAIELDKYKFDKVLRDEMRKKLRIDGDEVVIGIIGRLVYTKNQEFIINILPRLSNFIKTRLLIIGEGSRREEYQQLVDEMKLQDKVSFLGYRDDISQLLQAIDIFCMPSRNEAFGIALVEAQASGVFCIASDQIPIEACMNDGRVKRLPLESELWIEAIYDCCDTGEQWIRQANEMALTRDYDIRAQVRKIEELYMGDI